MIIYNNFSWFSLFICVNNLHTYFIISAIFVLKVHDVTFLKILPVSRNSLEIQASFNLSSMFNSQYSMNRKYRIFYVMLQISFRRAILLIYSIERNFVDIFDWFDKKKLQDSFGKTKATSRMTIYPLLGGAYDISNPPKL